LARTFFLSVSIAAVLLFVHSEEYYQQEMDEDDEKKTILLEKNVLTNLYSRYAFNQMLRQYAVEKMDEKFSIFVIDINGSKTLNDSKGHETGDALICAAVGSVQIKD
jgi:GGDEF domain-containing protein